MTLAGVGLTVVVTGPMGPLEELEPLRAAGHRLVVGRHLDEPGRAAYTEAKLITLCRAADVSHSEAGRRANLALAMDQILAVARGEVPAYVVNRDAIEMWRTRTGSVAELPRE